MSESFIEWSQPNRGYQAPEFYHNGEVAVVHINGRSISIHRDGSALVYYDSLAAFSDVEVIRSAAQFRRAFPDGNIPEDDTVEWKHNAWFDLYEGDEHLDAVAHTFDDAFEEVLEIVARESLGAS
jgi:hypothetical protein